MPRLCKQCRRANPHEAAYCHHDGSYLGDHAAGEAGAARRRFTVAFVFPSGRRCHTLDELALACHADPAAAVGLLRKGHLESFLAGQGRADLAAAARAAARAADRDRGLDDILGRLSASALAPGRLRVEPAVLDLGTLRPGEDRQAELVLYNEGRRLVHGSASCDESPWLSLGDGPGLRRKQFLVWGQATLPVRIVGRSLRAYPKPQEAEIWLESNGGTVRAVVRVHVPARPFPEGILAGALSPRQLAEKAREAPKEAAPLIESGAVARWYRDNGWDYPVAGPTASGVAAVQQLFEALGLVKTPRVELSEDAVHLRGAPGEAVEYVVAAVTQENRAAVAHGTSDQPWLHVGRTVFRGRSAFLPLNVPAVPARPGETLRANVTVTANGGQRFVVPVTLAVAGVPPAVAAPAPPPLPATVSAAPAVPPPPPTAPAGRSLIAPVLSAGLLGLVLLGVVLRDYLAPLPAPPPPPPAPELDSVPRLEVRYHSAKRDDVLEKLDLTDPQPTMRFGLVTLRGGKEVGTGAGVRRLTFDPWGRTNNTCLRFDGTDQVLFGSARGRWEESEEKTWKDDQGQDHEGAQSVWVYDARRVQVTQPVELVRGQQSNLLDTCRVRYRVENHDRKDHQVGIRFLLDTFIGGNDGVPFTIPGDSALCDTFKDLPSQARDRRLPDFLQALEKPDLAHPGTVAHLRLKLENTEAPARVTLGAWPNEKLRVRDRNALGPSTLWEVPLLPIKALGLNDSAVTVYWKEQPLKAGAAREVGFEYGLWELASQGDRLAATIDGLFRPGGELTVVAYVGQAGPQDADETVTLDMPEGFQLLDGKATQPVPKLPPGARTGNRPVTWRVQAGPTGRYDFTVKTSSGLTQTLPVEIKAAIFD